MFSLSDKPLYRKDIRYFFNLLDHTGKMPGIFDVENHFAVKNDALRIHVDASDIRILVGGNSMRDVVKKSGTIFPGNMYAGDEIRTV
jgi:hypothetical protein